MRSSSDYLFVLWANNYFLIFEQIYHALKAQLGDVVPVTPIFDICRCR